MCTFLPPCVIVILFLSRKRFRTAKYLKKLDQNDNNYYGTILKIFLKCFCCCCFEIGYYVDQAGMNSCVAEAGLAEPHPPPVPGLALQVYTSS